MKSFKKIITTILILLPIIGIIYVGINADSIGAKIEQKEAANKAEIAKEHKIDKSKWEYIGDISIDGGDGGVNLVEFFNFTDAKYFYINPQIVTGEMVEHNKEYGGEKYDNFQIYKVDKEQIENIYYNMEDIPNSEYFLHQPTTKKNDIYEIDKMEKIIKETIEDSFTGNSSGFFRDSSSYYLHECKLANSIFWSECFFLKDYYKKNKLETKCENVKINQVGLAKNVCEIGGAYIFKGTMDIETIKAKEGFKGNKFIPRLNEKRTAEFYYMGRAFNGIGNNVFTLYFGTDY